MNLKIKNPKNMTLLRFKNLPAEKSFNNFMDGFLNDFPSLYSGASNQNGFGSAPVNIKEMENEYVLELVAPGLDKDDFKINLDNNLLTVSAEKKSETENQNEKVIRKEFKFQSIKRSFTLDEKVDAENIVAKYLNGVLTLNLPKKAEVKASVKEISVQ
jgi:HSP20 family protein